MVLNMCNKWLHEANFVGLLYPKLVFVIVFVLLIASPCAAHKLNVFAFVDADKLVVEGYLSGGVKAKGCPVEVYDSSGSRLLTGKTDSKGTCVFSVKDLPAGSKVIKIALEADMGHKGVYEIDLTEEVAALGNLDKSRPAMPPSNEAVLEATSEIRQSGQLNQDELTRQIEKIMDKKLEPLFRLLARQERAQAERQAVSRPGMTEIVGGIGWIMGLAGIAAFALSKRRRP